MSGFFRSSIGQKYLMSISGLFLILFLLVHLGINSLLMFGEEPFNQAAHFMGSNVIMKVIEPLLGLGFIIHILYASYLTLNNQKARPVNYDKVDQSKSSKWASRNMYVLGGLVFIFLVIHLINFFVKIKFTGVDSVTYGTETMHNSYALVAGVFAYWWYDVIYILGAIFLGLHLHHAFWSAFQTLGLSNIVWRKRWEAVGMVYTLIITIGFSIIPLYFLIFK